MDAPTSRTALALLLGFLVSVPGVSAEDACKQWKKQAAATRGYVAKLTFHRIDVTYDGQVINNQRDEKEMREGEEVRLDEVECEERTVDLEVLSVERKVKTKLRLLLSEAERSSRGPEAIQELLEVVLEPPPG